MTKRKRTVAQVNEALTKPVRLDGVGEDPVVKAFIQKISDADPQDAIDILLALQKHFTGASEEDTPGGKEKIMILRADADTAHQAEEAWKEDQVDFIQNVFEKNPPITGEAAERIKVRAARKYQEALQKHQKIAQQRQVALDREIKNGPREEVMVTGNFEVINGDMRHMPDVVKIMHRTFILKPGIHEVPRVVAQAYRNMQASRAEIAARKEAMSASDGQGVEFNEFVQRQRRLDREHNASEFSGGLA